MYVISKFRKMFWLMQATGFVAGIFFATICFNVSIMSNGELNFKYFPCWAGIIIVIALAYQIISILLLQTITVTDKEIIVKRLFFNKSKILQYNDFLNIERHKIQGRTKSGPVSDGYHLSVLNFVGGMQICISPDEFENYNDLIYAIRLNTKHEA